jgi:hypothetical protein
MTKSFEIPINSAPEELLAKVKKAAAEHGAEFTGDTQSGRFSGSGVEGEYRIEEGKAIVTVTNKPFIAPWSMVESTLRQFFST